MCCEITKTVVRGSLKVLVTFVCLLLADLCRDVQVHFFLAVLVCDVLESVVDWVGRLSLLSATC